MSRGTIWPSESRQFADEQTGATVWQLTDHPSINHTLHPLTNPFLPDEESLVFASFRSGAPNFFRAGFPSGDIVQLTDSTSVNSYSAAISHDGTTLFYTRGTQVLALDLGGLQETVLAEFPGGKLGEISLSPDGQWLLTAIRMERRFGIVLAATNGTGGGLIHHQDHPIVHPQFHPLDPSVLEYASEDGPRMHLMHRDGTGERCLYQNNPDEVIVHETWLGDTGDLAFVLWPRGIRRLNPETGEITTIAEFNAWHICPTADGAHILADTNHPDSGIQLVDVATGERQTICHPQSSNRGNHWALSAPPVISASTATAGRSASPTGSSDLDLVLGPEWTHPHPALSDSGRFAAFTSDRTGHSQLYVVQLPLEF